MEDDIIEYALQQKSKKSWLSLDKIIVIVIITICILGPTIFALTFGNIEETPIYDKYNIKIYYNYGDNIYVVNDNKARINIEIGDSYYNIANTKHKKVTLGLNSDYGDVELKVNNDILVLKYVKHSEDNYVD